MKLILSVFSVLVLALSSALAIDVPKLNTRVNDYAHVFTEEQQEDLEKQLADEETATSNQIFILTVDTTQDLEMSDYAQKVFEVWKPGIKNENERKNNGVLIVHDIKKRIIRIHTGYGMEGILPDITSHEITKKMGVYFKRGEFYQGYKVGIAEVIEKIKDEYKPTVVATDSGGVPLIVIIILGIALIVVVVVVGITILSPDDNSSSIEVPEICSDDPNYRKFYPEGPERPSKLSRAPKRSKSSRPARRSEESRSTRISDDDSPSIFSGASESSVNEGTDSSDSISGGGGESGGGGGESSY